MNLRKVYGRAGEEAAVAHLLQQGYRILDRNYFSRTGELDIVAEHRGTVCFVEVRMRSHATWGDPSQTVSRAKQRKVVKAALHWLMAKRLGTRMVRFDVISVLGRDGAAQVEHIPDAFDAGM